VCAIAALFLSSGAIASQQETQNLADAIAMIYSEPERRSTVEQKHRNIGFGTIFKAVVSILKIQHIKTMADGA
jgi:hypothetical protein